MSESIRNKLMSLQTTEFPAAPLSHRYILATAVISGLVLLPAAVSVALGVTAATHGRYGIAGGVVAGGLLAGLLLWLMASFRPVKYVVSSSEIMMYFRGFFRPRLSIRIALDNVAGIEHTTHTDVFREARLVHTTAGIFGLVGAYTTPKTEFECFYTNEVNLIAIRLKKYIDIELISATSVIISPQDTEGFIRTVESALAGIEKPTQ